MAISEVGATPQPEHNNDSIRKLHDEKHAESIFNSLINQWILNGVFGLQKMIIISYGIIQQLGFNYK